MKKCDGGKGVLPVIMCGLAYLGVIFMFTGLCKSTGDPEDWSAPYYSGRHS